MNVEIELHRRVRLMLRMNVMCEQLLTECKEEVCFPEPRCTQFAEAMDAMLLLQTQIAEHFVEEGLQYFDVTAKSHMLQHCALAAKHLSPRVVWCFAGEDMQKKLQTLAKSSLKGNGPAQATRKMCSRYRIALHLRFQEHAKGVADDCIGRAVGGPTRPPSKHSYQPRPGSDLSCQIAALIAHTCADTVVLTALPTDTGWAPTTWYTFL